MRRLKITNWVIMALLTACSGVLLGPRFSVSVLCGGVVIIANFNLLYRALRKAFMPPVTASARRLVLQYYLRLAATAAILLGLMVFAGLSAIGLLVGLSTVTLNLMLFAGLEAYKLIFREANT